MGKQSARLIYQGKDHKDIYFQGKYHRAMYLGDKLLWEKLAGEKYFLYRYNYTIDGVAYSKLRTFDVDSHILTDYEEYKENSTDILVYGNNLYIRASDNVFTHNGKTFFDADIEGGYLENADYRVYDGYILRKPREDNTYNSMVYYVATDKNVNELSRIELFETTTYFTSRVLVPCYPYFYEYLIFSRQYDTDSYYGECLICAKHGGYLLEYTCNGRILFCYCEQGRNLVFTTTGVLHIFENGSIRYRVNIGGEVYACLKKGNKYILYLRSSNAAPFYAAQTTDFTDLQRVSEDYLEIENPNNPSAPYVIILNGNESNNILKNYDDCYYCTLGARDIRTQLTQSTMFEDGVRRNFDSLLLNLNFRQKVSSSSITARVYIDDLTFQNSDKNYVYLG